MTNYLQLITHNLQLLIMSREHPKKQQAKKLFIENGYTGKEIHDLLGISEKGISKWRMEENWDEDRELYEATPNSLLKFIIQQIKMIKESTTNEDGSMRLLNPTEVNSITTLSSSIQKLRGNVSPQVTMEVLNGFLHFLKNADFELAQKMTDYIAEYYNNYKTN